MEEIMSRKVVLAGGCRTAIGVMGGALSTVPAADLGTIVIKEAPVSYTHLSFLFTGAVAGGCGL